jgi:cytochrome c oxidase cbb3-type subunit 3
VRSLAPAATASPPDSAGSRWARGDAALGGRLYSASCAPCHGERGEGKEGPALNNRVFLASASDTYLYETIRSGRRGTSMPGFEDGSTAWKALSPSEMESIVAFLNEWR